MIDSLKLPGASCSKGSSVLTRSSRAARKACRCFSGTARIICPRSLVRSLMSVAQETRLSVRSPWRSRPEPLWKRLRFLPIMPRDWLLAKSVRRRSHGLNFSKTLSPAMRILQVSSPLQLGGGETHVIELTQALRQRGHDVVVAGRPGSAVKPDVEFPFRNALDLGTVRRLRRFIKEGSFDIVHAHVARDYPLTLAAARNLAPKVVLTRHLLYPVRSNFLYKHVDGWIAPTTQILTTLAKLKPRASVVIPNWVDLEKFTFKPHMPHEPLTLGLLGQISPHKGHDDAVEAMRLLGPKFRLLIAGKGESNYLDGLRAKSAGLPVDFVGFVELPE